MEECSMWNIRVAHTHTHMQTCDWLEPLRSTGGGALTTRVCVLICWKANSERTCEGSCMRTVREAVKHSTRPICELAHEHMGACGGCCTDGAPRKVQKAVSHQEEGVSRTVWLFSWCEVRSADGKPRFGWETSEISTKFMSSFKILFFLY